ncbi:multiheme c-type cytochrome [Thiolapillus sp.]
MAAETGNPFFTHTYFTGSGQCADCHNSLIDNNSNDISIVTDWSTSMMANGTRDPYWRAKVASELHRNPQISGELNDKCSRCHAPMANDSAHKLGDNPQIFTEGMSVGFLDPANSRYFDMAMDAVSCTACHQMEDNGKLGTLEGVSGKFTIDDYVADGTDKVNRPAYGQYADPRQAPMQNFVEFTPEFGAHTSTSEFCAICHDLKTPFVDANGDIASTTPESEFPEQMAYSEWEHSDFADGKPKASTCQDCHMPKVAGSVKIATRPFNLNPRPDFAKHTFHGANTVMLDMLNRNKDALGVAATGFERTITDTRSFLQQAAAITINSSVVANGKLSVNLRVSNHSGHKFPSGYPSRRAYIHFTVKDSNNTVLFESGHLNNNGSISGASTDTNLYSIEPHYQEITSQDQVQIYEPIMENTDQEVTHTLLRAARYAKDNRLLPAGFDKSTAPSDIAVRGAAANDPDFIGGSDDIVYTIDLAGVNAGEDIRVEAEIRYQPLAFGHLQDMFKDSAAVAQVNSFKTLFEAAETLRDERVDSSLNTIANRPGCSGENVVLKHIDISTLFICEAGNSITAADFSVTSDQGNAQLKAKTLSLQPGFRVSAPAVFSASIL